MDGMVSLTGLRRAAADGDPVTMVNAYDSSFGRLVDESAVDLILVGDSVGVTTLGYDGTDRVTVDEMVHHTAAVARSVDDTVVVADLPFGSYNASTEDAVRTATRLKKEGGADAVKLEGGSDVADATAAIDDGGIPVFGHVGVTPQTAEDLSVVGGSDDEADRVLDAATAVDDAGAVGVVLELVTRETAAAVTDAVDAMTLGIGAGPDCDGQVLTLHDLLGLQDVLPETAAGVRGTLAADVRDRLDAFDAAVTDGRFPGDDATPTADGDDS